MSFPPATLPSTLAVLMVQDRTTIFIVVAAFLLLLMTIGWTFRHFSKDASDYFRAGGKATWWLVGGSQFMYSFSAWTFTGAAGAAFQAGWSLPVMFFSNVVMFATVALFSGPWFRQLRCITVADMIRLRFGAGMEQFVAYLGLFTGPIYGGVQLYGLAIFTSTLLGLNFQYMILLLGFVVLFYSALSGAWAVLAADFIQALVVMPISILLAVLCLWQLGGPAGLLAGIEHAGLHAAFAPVKSSELLRTMDGVDPSWFTWAFFFAWYGNQFLLGNSLNNGGKYLSVKDGREARRAALLAGGLFLVGLVIWFVPPMTARLLIPDEVMAMPLPKPVEGAYAAMSLKLLPAGLVGLVLVGMCAATMSSLDSGLTNLAGIITENIHPAAARLVGRRPLEGRGRLLLGKFVNLLCAIAIVGAALSMATFGRGGIFKILMDVMATLSAPLTTPLMLGLFLRRVPTPAPYVSVVGGFLVSFSIYLAPLVSSAQPWPFHLQVGTVVAVSSASFLLVCLFMRPDATARAREQEFFARRNRPVDFAAEVGVSNDGRQLRIIGTFGTVIGVFTLLLLLPASSAGHAGKIIAVAFTTLGIGLLMIWAGNRLRGSHG